MKTLQITLKNKIKKTITLVTNSINITKLGMTAVIVEPLALTDNVNTADNFAVVETGTVFNSKLPISILDSTLKHLNSLTESFGGYCSRVVYKKLGLGWVDPQFLEAGGASWLDYAELLVLVTLTDTDFCKESLLFTALFIIATRLFIILKSLLSHSRSKSFFFVVYQFAAGCIFSQCLLLITADTSKAIHEHGILLLYVYATAVLMLFLIFLALTTCESYLNIDSGDKDTEEVKRGVIFMVFVAATVIAFSLYSVAIVSSLVKIFEEKQTVLTALFSNSNQGNHWRYVNHWSVAEDFFINENVAKNKELAGVRVGRGYNLEILPINKNIEEFWSVFDFLKFDIIDTKYEYLLSASIQMCALLIVILSLVI